MQRLQHPTGGAKVLTVLGRLLNPATGNAEKKIRETSKHEAFGEAFNEAFCETETSQNTLVQSLDDLKAAVIKAEHEPAAENTRNGRWQRLKRECKADKTNATKFASTQKVPKTLRAGEVLREIIALFCP